MIDEDNECMTYFFQIWHEEGLFFSPSFFIYFAVVSYLTFSVGSIRQFGSSAGLFIFCFSSQIHWGGDSVGIRFYCLISAPS